MKATSDPDILIESERPGYVIYRRRDGRRWAVYGKCDNRGDCLIGSVVDGFGVIKNHSDIEQAKKLLGVKRLGPELDVPVTPEFKGCCPFTFKELPNGR